MDETFFKILQVEDFFPPEAKKKKRTSINYDSSECSAASFFPREKKTALVFFSCNNLGSLGMNGKYYEIIYIFTTVSL